MPLDFDKYSREGQAIVNRLAEGLKIPKDKAGRILRAVLYAIRNRISVDESLQIIAQLPMALKGIYVDQWDPWHSFHRIRRIEEFINEVRKCDIGGESGDFESDESVMSAVQAVFTTLNYFLSDRQVKDVIAVLPQDLKHFVNNRIRYSTMPL